MFIMDFYNFDDILINKTINIILKTNLALNLKKIHIYINKVNKIYIINNKMYILLRKVLWLKKNGI